MLKGKEGADGDCTDPLFMNLYHENSIWTYSAKIINQFCQHLRFLFGGFKIKNSKYVNPQHLHSSDVKFLLPFHPQYVFPSTPGSVSPIAPER